jgi:hypothetical protein
VAGCPGTGAAEWLAQYAQCWARVGREQGVVLPALPEAWLREHRLPLAVVLIPLDLVDHLRTVPCNKVRAVAVAFHLTLVERLAEVLRCREELRMQRRTAAAGQGIKSPLGQPGPSLPGAPLSVRCRWPSFVACNGSHPRRQRLPPSPPPRNSREQEARRAASQGLAAWIRDHPHLE